MFSGSAHGSQIEKSFVLQTTMKLKPGVNLITLLGSLIGLPVRNILPDQCASETL